MNKHLNPPTSWQIPSYEVTHWTQRTQRSCVVIPVINEGPRIASLLGRMKNLRIPEVADVIIMDGGSSDDSLSSTLIESTSVRAVLTKTGPGKLSAQLRCAYSFALLHGYEDILTIDGNDKDDPSDIPAFIDALNSGVDFVQGSRFVNGGVAVNTPRSRHLAIRLVHAPVLSIFSGFHWTDTTQGFRAYSARLLRDPQVAPFRDVFANYELLAYLSYRAPRLGYTCKELPTTRSYPDGTVPTKINGFKGNLELLSTLVRAVTGRLDPRPRATAG